MRISDWSSDVCSSDLANAVRFPLCVNRGVDGTAFCVVETIDVATHLTDDCLEHRNAIEPIILVPLCFFLVDHRERIEAEPRAHRELDQFAVLQDRKSTRMNSSH